MAQAGTAKALSSTELPELTAARTEIPEAELNAAPEVKELTDGTRKRALELVKGAESAEQIKAPGTPEGAKATGEAAKIQQETANAAAQAVGAEQAPTAQPEPLPPPAQPVETTKPRGFFGKLVDGLKSFWRVITFRKPKKETEG